MIPFDAEKLQRLMAEHDVAAVLATSRHNVRYLTGGYLNHFFARTARNGSGRYLAVVGVPRDCRNPFYVGRNESADIEAYGGLWIGDRRSFPRGPRMTERAAVLAAAALRERGLGSAAVGVEMPFLPADAFATLRSELPGARFVDASDLLGELRAVKRPDEVELLRSVHRSTAEAIRSTLHRGRPEWTTRELAADVARGVAERGPAFLYCYANVGPGLLRAPSGQPWGAGAPLHLDAGAELGTYVSDICRMGSVGAPPSLAAEMYAGCLAVQDELRRSVGAGMSCGELQRLGTRLMRATPWGECGNFLAHGLGAVSHEPPAIDADATRPLEPGMVLSLETEFISDAAGHVKYEDSVVLTPSGCEGLGDVAREWCQA